MASAERGESSLSHVYKGKKGFGYGVGEGRAGPGNTMIRGLLADERFLEAVLFFLKSTKVGMAKPGVIQKG